MNTIEYIDAVKARYGWNSDYKLAQMMQISKGRVSNYRNGRQGMDDDLCIQVANLLNLPPEQVLIDIIAERSKNPKAVKLLQAAAKQIGMAACSLFLTLSMMYSTAQPVYSADLPIDNIYIMRSQEFFVLSQSNFTDLFFSLFLANQLFLYCLLQFCRWWSIKGKSLKKRSLGHEK